MQVALLQEDLKAEMLIVEQKKAGTFALIESIGQEKGIVDEAVESSRADEEDAARLQASPQILLQPCIVFLIYFTEITHQLNVTLSELARAGVTPSKATVRLSNLHMHQ